MKVFVAALIFIALCVLGLCVGILFHKGFPKSDIDDNPELVKRGISCYKHEDARLQRGERPSRSSKCSGNVSDSCAGCAFFDNENFKK